MPRHPLGEEPFSNVQRKTLLTQLQAVPLDTGTSLEKYAKFRALFTATNLDPGITEPLDDTSASEEASESPAGGNKLKFCVLEE